MRIPHTRRPQPPAHRPGGFWTRVRPIEQYQPPAPGTRAVALLGVPDDTGVGLNGGRVGARQGPAAIREALGGLGVADPPAGWPDVYDAGDVAPVGEDMDASHDRVSEAAAALAAAGLTPLGLGGGHDTTFALVRGVISALPGDRAPRAGVYLDAHLDVRERAGSGMPFRALVERCGVEALSVTGLVPWANTADHMRYFRDAGGVVLDAGGPDPPPPDRAYFASLDLDAIDASHAPGVSWANPAGVSASRAIAWARAAASSPQLRCFDVVELCPPHDADARTARLAGALVLTALTAMAATADQGP